MHKFYCTYNTESARPCTLYMPKSLQHFDQICFMLHLLTVEILSVLILVFLFLLIAYHISMFYSNKPNSTILQ